MSRARLSAHPARDMRGVVQIPERHRDMAVGADMTRCRHRTMSGGTNPATGYGDAYIMDFMTRSLSRHHMDRIEAIVSMHWGSLHNCRPDLQKTACPSKHGTSIAHGPHQDPAFSPSAVWQSRRGYVCHFHWTLATSFSRHTRCAEHRPASKSTAQGKSSKRQGTQGMRVCKAFGPNRTKMFHAKPFCPIGEKAGRPQSLQTVRPGLAVRQHGLAALASRILSRNWRALFAQV